MRNLFLAAFTFICSLLHAQETALTSLFDTLYQLRDVHIRLTYPFDSLVRSNNEEIPAKITISHANGKLMREVSMNLNIRGKYRRLKCGMPPLLLNFKKSTLRELHLNSIDEMKMVTHCIEGPDGVQNIAEEYMCYQIYESLTQNSYRTIWVDVEYCNSLNPDSCFSSVAFLIEPDKVVQKRLGVMEKKLFNVSQDSVDYDSYKTVASFNFMIGNRDWDLVSGRNAKLFFQPALGKYIVIPYDFDYSNIVAASYRREIKTENMYHPYDRVYSGYYFKDVTGASLQNFLTNKEKILGVVEHAPNLLDAERRSKIYNYLEDWFKWVTKTNERDLIYGVVCPYKGGL